MFSNSFNCAKIWRKHSLFVIIFMLARFVREGLSNHRLFCHA